MKIDANFRCFLYGFLGFFIAALLAAIVATVYSDYRNRAVASESYLSVRPLQYEIEEAIIKHQSVSGAAIHAKQTSNHRQDQIIVLTDGSIVVRVAKYTQVLVLTPSFTNGAVQWQCIGGPVKEVPPDCR